MEVYLKTIAVVYDRLLVGRCADVDSYALTRDVTRDEPGLLRGQSSGWQKRAGHSQSTTSLPTHARICVCFLIAVACFRPDNRFRIINTCPY